MKTLLTVYLIALLLPGSVLATTILVIGDSISAAYGLNEQDGWVALAEQELNDDDTGEIRFINASISGDTTGGGLYRLPGALERFRPDIVVIELGGNDGLRGYPVKKIRSNLQAMTAISQNAGADVLLLGMQIPANYGPAYTRLFAKTFVDAAESSGATLLPFMLDPISKDRDFFQTDGIHPTAAAQPLLASHVLTELRAMVQHVASP